MDFLESMQLIHTGKEGRKEGRKENSQLDSQSVSQSVSWSVMNSATTEFLILFIFLFSSSSGQFNHVSLLFFSSFLNRFETREYIVSK